MNFYLGIYFTITVERGRYGKSIILNMYTVQVGSTYLYSVHRTSIQVVGTS